MKYCIGNRGSGISTRAIEYCFKNNFALLVANEVSRKIMQDKSIKNKTSIKVYSISDVRSGKYDLSGTNFVIDNSYSVLRQLLGTGVVGIFDSVEDADVENIYRDFKF